MSDITVTQYRVYTLKIPGNLPDSYTAKLFFKNDNGIISISSNADFTGEDPDGGYSGDDILKVSHAGLKAIMTALSNYEGLKWS